MGRILGTVLWACVAVSAACAADAEWREIFVAEPFTGAPLRAGFAGRHGFAWGNGRAVRVFDLESGNDRGIFLEHTTDVGAAAASPDGSRIASGDGSGTIRIWDVATRREVLKLEGPPGAVVEIRWTPTGGHLGWVTESGRLTIARTENGRTVASHDIPPGAEGEFVVSPDGKWARILLVSSAWDGRENLAALRTLQWNLLDGGAPRKRTWERRDPDPGTRPYTAARVDPRDGRIAFADGDDLVVWSMDDDREAFRLEGCAGPVVFPEEGDLLVGTPAALVAVTRGGETARRHAGVPGLQRLEVTGDGRLAIGLDARGTAWCWALGRGGPARDAGVADDIRTGRSLAALVSSRGRSTLVRSSDAELSPVDADPDSAIAFSPAGDRAITIVRGRPVIVKFGEITGVAAGEEVRAPVTQVVMAGGVPAASSGRESVLFDPSGGERLRAGGRVEIVAGTWLTVRSGRDVVLHSAIDGSAAAEFRDVRALALTPHRIAALTGDDAVVFDPEGSRELLRVRAPLARSVALCANNSVLILGQDPLESWNVSRRRRNWRLDIGAVPLALCAQPAGEWLAALLPSGDLVLVDSVGDEVLRLAGVESPDHVAFTADGSSLLACSDGRPRIWSLARRPAAVSFAREAGFVIAAPAGPRWCVLTRTGADLYEGDRFALSFPGATSAAFLPDGALAVAAPEGVRLWDGRWTGVVSESGTLVAASADGRRIAVATGPRLGLFERP